MTKSDKPIPQPGEDSPDAKDAASKWFDAREYLEHNLDRNPSDLLTIRHIPHSSAYRVNWYDRAVVGKLAIVGLSIRYIRKSRFLFCYLGTDGKPVITYPTRQ